MIGVPGDRVAAAVLLIAAAAIALEAQTFRVGFLTDPLGPMALPLLVAAMLAAGAIRLLFRPDAQPVWPDRTARHRMAAVVASFIVYAAILPRLGFLTSTTIAVATLSVLFGAPPRRAIFAAAGYTVGLYLLFVYALGLSLPIGTLFIINGR